MSGCATTSTSDSIASFSEYELKPAPPAKPLNIVWPEALTLEKDGKEYFAFDLQGAQQLIKAQTLSELQSDKLNNLQFIVESQVKEISSLVDAGIALEDAYKNQQFEIEELEDQFGLDRWMIRGLLLIGTITLIN